MDGCVDSGQVGRRQTSGGRMLEPSHGGRLAGGWVPEWMSSHAGGWTIGQAGR